MEKEKLILGFSKSTKKIKILSDIIMWADESDYSHVYLRRESKYGEYVYQASGLAVNFTGIDIFLSHNQPVHEIVLYIDPGQKAKLLEFFISHAGVPYGVDQLLKISHVLICKKLGIKYDTSKMLNGNNKFICSELGLVVVRDILGYDITLEESSDLVTPRDLYEAINYYLKIQADGTKD